MTDQATMNSTAAPAQLFYEQTWDLEYRHALGETTSRFLRGLAEHKIWGTRSTDGRVLVPPRSFDDQNHERTVGWVEVGLTGVIEMSTVVYEPFKGLPEPPYAIAYVLLEGADTALVGYVRGVDLTDQSAAVEAVRIGTPVEVKFAENPVGTAADYWFEPSA